MIFLWLLTAWPSRVAENVHAEFIAQAHSELTKCHFLPRNINLERQFTHKKKRKEKKQKKGSAKLKGK